MSSRRGGYYVAIVHIIAAIVGIISLVIAFATLWERNYGIQLLVSIGSLAIGIVICLGVIAISFVLFLGLRGGAPVLILPFLIAQAFMLIGLLFAFIVAIVTLIGLSGAVFGPDRYSTSLVYVNDQTLHQSEALTAGVLVLSFIGFFVEVWFFTVILGAYRFFVDEIKYRG